MGFRIDPELILLSSDLKFNAILKVLDRMFEVFVHKQRREIPEILEILEIPLLEAVMQIGRS